MLSNRRQRRVVVEVLVVASLISLLLVTLGWGYMALASSGEDQLVRSGLQQIVVCRKGSTGSGAILDKITQDIPGAEGTWGVEKDGDCRVMRHYAPGGPAD